MAATQEELEEAEGIGPDRAELIAEWFADDENRALVEDLRALGLQFEVGEADRPVEGPLTGQAVRDHRHARGLQPRAGEGRARGARRQGLGLGLEEDDRGDRRGEPGVEGREGARRPACRFSARRSCGSCCSGAT